MRALILLMLLTACSGATGPSYTSAPDGSVLIYHHHESSGVGRTLPLEINGHACDLHNDGFIIVSSDKVYITAAMFGRPGTSDITIPPHKETVYVRAEVDMTKQWLLGFSFVGAFAGEASSDHKGPVIFTLTKEPQISTLHQDCI